MSYDVGLFLCAFIKTNLSSYTLSVMFMNERHSDKIAELRSEREKNSQKLKQSKDYFTTVTVWQSVFCILLFFLFFFTVKGGGQGAEALKEDLNLILTKQIENTDSESVIKNIKSFFSEPVNLMPAFSPVEEETTEEVTLIPTEEADDTTAVIVGTETIEDVEDTTRNIDVSEEETTVSDDAEEEVTVNNGSGGEDIDVFKAKENTSFSPVATTCEAVAPVNSTNYTSYFGYRTNPITQKESFHTGLDIAAPMGSKVRATYSGKVRKTGEDSRSGKYVIMTHSDGFETFYCHLSEILAEEGAVIRQGETIALVGSTGWSTGPHLHFEVRNEGERLNPLWVLEDRDS